MNSTTKTSDVQMSPEELATLQGLGYSKEVGSMLKTALRPADISVRPTMMQNPALVAALKNKLPGLQQAIAQQQAGMVQPDIAPTAPPAVAPPAVEASMMDKLKEALKNPMVLGGIVIAVGAIGFLLWKRSQRSVAQVAAVETFGLEGMDEKPKRKRRRKSRKNKK